MGCAPVQFSYALWTATFPELASIPMARAESYFDMATIIQRNDGGGPITKPNVQLSLLNLLTAHIASLYSQSLGDQQPGAPKPANSPVGRINSATEGSVSVQTDYGTTVGQQQAWLIQTQYGATWWAMTAQYRTARYISGALQPGGLGPSLGYGGAPGYGGFR